ncbi:MAG: acyl-CoA thioesterase, partial [Halobacteria archaeon]|nr:acyl-CoA thioesterase [Halobacteria archaeon]
VDKEDPLTGQREKTAASCFVFVAVDESGEPVSVPSLTVGSERGEELRREGLEAESQSESEG